MELVGTDAHNLPNWKCRNCKTRTDLSCAHRLFGRAIATGDVTAPLAELLAQDRLLAHYPRFVDPDKLRKMHKANLSTIKEYKRLLRSYTATLERNLAPGAN
jgi:hypothetical protein